VTSPRALVQPRPVALLPPTLQTITAAISKNIAIARARTRSRIMAVVKADGLAFTHLDNGTVFSRKILEFTL
jgi:alanine racemase